MNLIRVHIPCAKTVKRLAKGELGKLEAKGLKYVDYQGD
jgi:hypothetical protein